MSSSASVLPRVVLSLFFFQRGRPQPIFFHGLSSVSVLEVVLSLCCQGRPQPFFSGPSLASVLFGVVLSFCSSRGRLQLLFCPMSSSASVLPNVVFSFCSSHGRPQPLFFPILALVHSCCVHSAHSSPLPGSFLTSPLIVESSAAPAYPSPSRLNPSSRCCWASARKSARG